MAIIDQRDCQAPEHGRVFTMAHEIAIFYVDTLCELPVGYQLGNVVQVEDSAYRNFEAQWKYTH